MVTPVTRQVQHTKKLVATERTLRPTATIALVLQLEEVEHHILPLLIQRRNRHLQHQHRFTRHHVVMHANIPTSNALLIKPHAGVRATNHNARVMQITSNASIVTHLNSLSATGRGAR